MKRVIVKILGASALVALITLNVTSTMEFTPGGEEVKASMRSSIPCWSAYGAGDRGDNFVYCLTCAEKSGKERNSAGSCSPTLSEP